MIEKEPLIHSCITDGLPDNHPWSGKHLYCTTCEVMIHAGNNECMQTWVETSDGNYCLPCFVKWDEKQ